MTWSFSSWLVPSSILVVSVVWLAAGPVVDGPVVDGPVVDGPVVRSFQRVVLSDQFWCEGAHHGDFNRDGVMDVVAGPWWWAGPDFAVRREIYEPRAAFDLRLGERTTVKVAGFEGALGRENAYSDNFFSWPHDFDGDGWLDVLVVGFPGEQTAWYENPGEEDGRWRRRVVFEQTDHESPVFTDLTGDGRPELVCVTRGAYGYAQAEAEDPSKPWRWHRISRDRGYGKFTYGLGVGDVNGDGRLDLLEKDGWFEQPASLEGDPEWRHHPQVFAELGGAQMFAYDVNGDGLNDVITSLAAHAFGLAWYEQTEEGGVRAWRKHLIMGQQPEENPYGVKFSELHALDLVDMNGDGLKDIVTGKRFWSHGRLGDPDRNGQAVLYWFELARGPEGVVFVPHVIDTDSGVGTQVVAGDVDGDGRPDVVVGNKKGVFVHLQRVAAATAEEAEAARPKRRPAPVAATAVAAVGVDGRALNLGFETGDLTDWTVEGEAFGRAVVKGDAVAARRQDMRSGHAGQYWLGGYENGGGDAATGSLRSAVFVLSQPYLGFLLGGGSGHATRVELVNAASGMVLAVATGPDNEEMERVFIDVRAWQGAGVVLRIVDEATTGWGHVNFDDAQLYDAPPLGAREAGPAAP